MNGDHTCRVKIAGVTEGYLKKRILYPSRSNASLILMLSHTHTHTHLFNCSVLKTRAN